jgi:uncharacterized membrane protein YoaK (UPF0700 family)
MQYDIFNDIGEKIGEIREHTDDGNWGCFAGAVLIFLFVVFVIIVPIASWIIILFIAPIEDKITFIPHGIIIIITSFLSSIILRIKFKQDGKNLFKHTLISTIIIYTCLFFLFLYSKEQASFNGWLNYLEIPYGGYAFGAIPSLLFSTISGMIFKS